MKEKQLYNIKQFPNIPCLCSIQISNENVVFSHAASHKLDYT